MSRKTAILAWFWNPCSGWAHCLPVFTQEPFSEARHFPSWSLGLFLLRSPPVCSVNGSLGLYCDFICCALPPFVDRKLHEVRVHYRIPVYPYFTWAPLPCDTGPKISLVEWLLRPWGKSTLSFGKCPLTHCIMDLLLSVMKSKIAKARVFRLHQMGCGVSQERKGKRPLVLLLFRLSIVRWRLTVCTLWLRVKNDGRTHSSGPHFSLFALKNL